jgi:hypothetical protein
MTANQVRHGFKDWALGITAFMLFGAVVVLLASIALRATAPYGWNHIALPATVAGLAMLSWALRRRARPLRQNPPASPTAMSPTD